VPLDGEAGVGYRMRAGFDLPPLMFTHDEAKALVASVRLAQPRLDGALAAQAEMALAKIMGALPPGVRTAAESLALFTVTRALDEGTRQRLQQLREATEQRQKLHLHYLDLHDKASQRTVRPLGCFYWDAVWTLAAWCELRQDFRSFRVDRLRAVTTLEQRFRDEPGKTLADLQRAVGARP
jgi:predicted DNA-binding transcriptional regulator YafY